MQFCLSLSLKDDDSGDHDQDNSSPKDGEKEKNDEEDKDSNTTKRKVGVLFSINYFLFWQKTNRLEAGVTNFVLDNCACVYLSGGGPRSR